MDERRALLAPGWQAQPPSYLGTAILDTFECVGQIAPGSYGLLYVWDDESNQHPNEFRVFKLARGQVTEHIGAFAALVAQCVIQLYVVPRVETRKRREDRWERDVRELGQLLTTDLTNQANELHAAQLVFRDARDTSGNPALITRLAREAEQEAFAYGSLIGTQVEWLIAQILRPDPDAGETKQLDAVWLNYRMGAIGVRPLPEHDTRTDHEFDQSWDRERAARKALIDQVKVLADLPHPPRRSWLRNSARLAGESFDLLGGPDPG